MTGVAGGVNLHNMRLVALGLTLLAALPASAELPGVHLEPRNSALRVPPACILHVVANDMADQIGRHRSPELEARIRAAAKAPNLPTVHLESRTTLAEFQEAVRPQEPHANVFSNFFAVAANKIFLIEDEPYYTRLKRHIEDSLAHEYAHYLQVTYLNYSVANLATDDAEFMAVEYQSRYRDAYVRTGRAPVCP